MFKHNDCFLKTKLLFTVCTKWNFIKLQNVCDPFIRMFFWNKCFLPRRFHFINHFSKIHRSVLCEITTDLLYFWDMYDVSLGRSTDYLSRTNVLVWFRFFKEKRDSNTGVFQWNLWNFQEQWWLLLKTRNITHS